MPWVLAAMACFSSASIATSDSGPAVTIKEYNIEVRIDPEEAALSARARVEATARRNLEGEVVFFLNEGLRLTGGAAERRDEKRTLPFSPAGTPVTVRLPGEVRAGEDLRIDLSYEGSLEGSGPYRITPRLTELSQYASWYPRFEGSEEFPYEMTVTVPENQRLVSNGEKIFERRLGGQRQARFRGTSVARDLLIIASSALDTAGGGPVTVHGVDLSGRQTALLSEEAAWILSFYTAGFGSPLSGAGARIVVLPRTGGSYARPPLIVLESRPADRWTATPEKERAEFHRLAHELAHLFWPWADSATADDWLNEGLAEFCALRASGERFGAGHERELVRACRLRVLGVREPVSILDTRRSDERAEILFYDKAALVIRMLEALVNAGDDAEAAAFGDALGAYRRLGSPTSEGFSRVMTETASRALGSFLDGWLRAERYPRLWLDLDEASPEESAAERLTLRGRILQEPEMLNGFPVTVRAVSGARKHDFKVRLEGGVTTFEVTVPFFPDDLVLDPDLLVPRKEETFRQDRLDQARRERVARLIGEGRQEEEMKRFQAALDLYRRAREIDPADMLPPYRMGRVYAALEDPERALRYHREALAANEHHAELRSWNQVRMGQMLDLMGKRREAKEAYRGALEVPDFGGAHEEAHRGLERPHRP